MKKVIAGLGVISLSLFLLAGCVSNTTQEHATHYVDSSGITAKIKANLLADADISSLKISVKTLNNNQVYLTGVVSSKQQAEKAAQIAAAVPGVKSVHNELVVVHQS
jgi:osmotically-inducible protein OsmY